MIGAIIGDIVGSVYEFDNIKTKDFPLFSENSRFTDDTVCTIAVADILLHGKEPATAMVERCRKYPAAGYGNLFMRWFNMPWQEPFNSFGNGAAMRVSPVAWLTDNLEDALAMSGLVTEITHNHPEGMKGARAAVHASFLAKQKVNPPQIRAEIEKVYEYDLSQTVDTIRENYEFNETCQGSVPQALICALEATDFEDAIRNAISIGGDSDTIGAITGGLAEALFGVNEALAEKAKCRLGRDMLVILDDFYAATRSFQR